MDFGLEASNCIRYPTLLYHIGDQHIGISDITGFVPNSGFVLVAMNIGSDQHSFKLGDFCPSKRWQSLNIHH